MSFMEQLRDGWKNKARAVLTLLAYALLLLGGLVLAKTMLMKPREVTVAPATKRHVDAEVQGSGTVTVNVLANIGAKITGRITRVLVDERDLVRIGQIIADMEDTDLRREVDRAQASLDAGRVSVWQTKRAWEREKRLVTEGAVSREEADGYEERYRVAASVVKAAEAELRLREFKLSEAKILTLVSGVVTRRWVNSGDAVVAGQPVITVADPSVTMVAAYVDQRFAGKIHTSQPATILLRGRENVPLRGEVYRVNPEAERVAEEMTVEVTFRIPTEDILIGQWADVYIQVGYEENALVVPKSAILPVANERFVFVVDSDKKVRRIKVEPGATSPRLTIVAVTGDLNAGEFVVLNPMGLKEGEVVRLVQDTTPGMRPMPEMH